MFKPIAELAPAAGVPAQQQPPAIPIEAVNSVFKVLHGRYGNLFLSRYATGEVDAQGKDKGIASARQVWAHDLRGFSAETIKTALDAVKTRHPDFPPTLPQFVALCAAYTPSRGPVASGSIGMSGKAWAEHTREAREKALARIREAQPPKPAAKPESGLALLKRAIADAVAAAGGDEVEELRRLDRMLAPAGR